MLMQLNMGDLLQTVVKVYLRGRQKTEKSRLIELLFVWSNYNGGDTIDTAVGQSPFASSSSLSKF